MPWPPQGVCGHHDALSPHPPRGRPQSPFPCAAAKKSPLDSRAEFLRKGVTQLQARMGLEVEEPSGPVYWPRRWKGFCVWGCPWVLAAPSASKRRLGDPMGRGVIHITTHSCQGMKRVWDAPCLVQRSCWGTKGVQEDPHGHVGLPPASGASQLGHVAVPTEHGLAPESDRRPEEKINKREQTAPICLRHLPFNTQGTLPPRSVSACCTPWARCRRPRPLASPPGAPPMWGRLLRAALCPLPATARQVLNETRGLSTINPKLPPFPALCKPLSGQRVHRRGATICPAEL